MAVERVVRLCARADWLIAACHSVLGDTFIRYSQEELTILSEWKIRYLFPTRSQMRYQCGHYRIVWSRILNT